MIPDGIEPSLPGCHPGVFAAGPRDRFIEWTYRELHPDFRHATPASSYWTISPILRFNVQVAGAGIEPADAWFKATHFYQQKLPRSVEEIRNPNLEVRNKVNIQNLIYQNPKCFRFDKSSFPKEGRAGLEPARWCLTGTRSAAELPTRTEFQKVPCGNRTRLTGLEAQHLCRSAKGTKVSQRVAVAGIEPASRRFRAAGPYQHRPHRILKVKESKCAIVEESICQDRFAFLDWSLAIRKVQEGKNP